MIGFVAIFFFVIAIVAGIATIADYIYDKIYDEL